MEVLRRMRWRVKLAIKLAGLSSVMVSMTVRAL
ncbi:hypothetical protein MAUB1S_01692 [Mycolicibacterium aubagnense]